ncbi:TRAP transporter small permease [Robertmurraya kyonggiensis]|uniref:TRAP transporter small permease n=1 Tax=Robertmurraya kyonggiensis TaxID=1037680 RepID=A0A4U1DB77_9BACI|nr:TRAP transporter small permease [Robertmurraya kyonggiensis]TKC19458.1 TRAP transporter small permease [Robertmurraya kyonggiensis]
MKILYKIENFVAIVFFLFGIAVSLYAVFSRYVLGTSQSWATEIFTMMLVWAIFIGFATALRDDKHVTIDILYDRMGPRMKKVSDIVTLIIGTVFSFFLVWTGINMVMTAFEQGIKTIDVGFPIWMNYLIMPITGILLFIHFVAKIYYSFKGITPETEYEEEEF